MSASTPAAVKPPPGNPRFPLLDALRAFAALSVVLTHVTGATNFNATNELGAYTARLDSGVSIFFLLSGFLLYRPFVAARREGRPAIRARDFARRRLLRIVPAYWVALTVLAIYPGLPGFEEHWLRFYTFTQIYWFDSAVQGIAPAWTLCIEITFYLVLPFIAAGIARLRPSVWGEVTIILALCVATNVLRQVLQAGGGFNPMQTTLLCFFDWFGYGMLLAVASVAMHGRETESRTVMTIVRRPWLPWLLALVAFWFVSTQLDLSRTLFAVYTQWSYLGEHLLYAVWAGFLLLPAIFGDWAGGWPRKLMSLRWLGWLGLVSYGIYLWHGPIMLKLDRSGASDWLPGSGVLSLLVTTLAITVPVAALSYYLIERPSLRFKDPRRRTPPPSAPGPVAGEPAQPAPVGP